MSLAGVTSWRDWAAPSSRFPGAVERLRARRRRRRAAPLVLAAVDPAQPYGAALPWPKPREDRAAGRRPARAAGAYVVLAGGEPIVYLERGGRALQTLVEPGDPRLSPPWLRSSRRCARGRIKRLALEKVDGESAMSSPLAPALTALGFQEGPRRLTLSA